MQDKPEQPSANLIRLRARHQALLAEVEAQEAELEAIENESRQLEHAIAQRQRPGANSEAKNKEKNLGGQQGPPPPPPAASGQWMLAPLPPEDPNTTWPWLILDPKQTFSFSYYLRNRFSP